MEHTQVIIVGAGPSGLALAMCLAKFRVYSVILEKEKGVTTDPRGVYLTGDAVRILFNLGIGHKIHEIGHVPDKLNFHPSNISAEPYLTMKIGDQDTLHHVVPEGLLMSQPLLETALRKHLEKNEFISLRTGCEVVSQLKDDLPAVEYVNESGNRKQISGQWLIGADGKVGIVRKYFLENQAGIKQEDGTHPYNGTWVASNLEITLPTPETHPRFPLWELGFTPERVYDLYWPRGWHFCSPPGKPTAAGRFGPEGSRLWRHEFAEEHWDDSMVAEDLFWEHMTPMITRTEDELGRKFLAPVSFPRDCIKILRCRPFRFAHKVANKWFHKRTVLIGDAAHVFPPFAGQGIASGLRDAHQLAWRLAVLLGSDMGKASCDKLLQAWADERRRSVDDAARLSIINGSMCNRQPSYLLLLYLRLHHLYETWTGAEDMLARVEAQGFKSIKNGFLVPDRNGGARLAQVHVQSAADRVQFLSDNLLGRGSGVFSLLVLSTAASSSMSLYEEAKAAIATSRIHGTVLSEDSIVVFERSVGQNAAQKADAHWGQWGKPDIPIYYLDDQSYLDRLGSTTKFAIVRPDFFVFSCAANARDLLKCLELLEKRLE